MSDVKLQRVEKHFGVVQVLHNIDLELPSEKFIVLVGPSGCGKSTLLRLIAGLDSCSKGDIFIDDECITNVSPADRHIAMVFQSYALYPHMTVLENITFGLRMAKKPQEVINERVEYAVEMLQLRELLQRKPKQLSGGQCQRVAIGRAIVRQPKVFLFDEPLSNLDAELRMEMRVEISKLHDKLDATMIYVTHDQVEAMTMADQIVIMKDGYIEQVGSPLQLYYHPINQFVAGFLGAPKMNFIVCKVVKANKDRVEIILDDRKLTLPISGTTLVKDQSMYLGVRPEHFIYETYCEFQITVDIDIVEALGNISYVHATLMIKEKIIKLVTEMSANKLFKIGSKIKLGIDVKQCYLFNETGLACQRLIGKPNSN